MSATQIAMLLGDTWFADDMSEGTRARLARLGQIGSASAAASPAPAR